MASFGRKLFPCGQERGVTKRMRRSHEAERFTWTNTRRGPPIAGVPRQSKDCSLGILNWLRRILGGGVSSDTVPFCDFDGGRVVRIPRSELASNAVQVQIQGIEGLVWVLPDELQPSPHQHEPFTEEIRDYLRYIQSAFAEHRDLTLEQWEDGFRRDANPEREIAMWSHAADVYAQFTDGESSADRRIDVYRCIVTCMTTSPDCVWDMFRPETLDQSEAEDIVNRFHGRDA